MMWGNGMGHLGWGWIFWLLLFIGVLVLVFVLVKALTGGSGQSGGHTPPPAPAELRSRRAKEILEERYARGEIGTEEYRERLATLEEDGR